MSFLSNLNLNIQQLQLSHNPIGKNGIQHLSEFIQNTR